MSVQQMLDYVEEVLKVLMARADKHSDTCLAVQAQFLTVWTSLIELERKEYGDL